MGYTLNKNGRPGPKNERRTRQKIAALQRLANNRLRVEVEIHADKLDADFGHKPLVQEVTDEYLMALHDREVKRLLREGKEAMQTVRHSKAVLQRLTDIYGAQTASRLHGFWYQLATHGEAECRKQYARTVFYRNRKLLTDAAVSWNGTDVKLIQSQGALPADFVPLRTHPRICTGGLSVPTASWYHRISEGDPQGADVLPRFD
jgi:II/X family phage/plasmid replication protein